MNKNLLLLLLLSLPFLAMSQETIPAGLKYIKGDFYIAPDNGIWQNKGVPYNWHRVARFSDITTAFENYYSKTISDNRFALLSRILTINGVSYDLSSDRSWVIPTSNGTVTSLSSSGGYGISSLVSMPTTTPNVSISADTASINGLVSKSRLSTSLVSILGASTPNSRLITINGVSQDLSSNRSWDIATSMGTVTNFSSINGYGISSSITTPSTTPVITIQADTTSSSGLASKSRLSAGLASLSASSTPSSRTITINGTTQDLTVNRSWTIPTSSGTVTSFSATSGYGLTSSVSTATSTPSLSISIDSASVNGVVSKSRLNSALGSYVPASRTITINGVPLDLSANRSWTISSTMPELLKNSNYTVLATDWGSSSVLNLMVDATAGNLTITLPTSGMYGRTIQIKKVDATMNSITVVGAIDRGTSIVLAMPDSNAQLYASQLLSKYVTQ